MPISSSAVAVVPAASSPSLARCRIVRVGREADRPGTDGFGDDRSHLVDLLGSGGLVVRSALAHHVGPHGAVRNQRGDIEHARQPLELVEVLGEGLPVPGHALRQRSAGDVLDALHQLDQPVTLARIGGREADPAVAHDDGGDAVPARRGDLRVPGGLAVVVGVDVDEARGHHAAVGIDLASRLSVDLTDGNDALAIYGDVARPCRGASAVDDGGVADDEIVHDRSPCCRTGPSS